MEYISLGILLVLTIVTVFGDMLIKSSADMAGFSGWKLLLGGVIIYGITTIGWFMLYRKVKFSTLSAVYSLFLISISVLIGVIYFKEKISFVEGIGLIFAASSIIILARFG
jgi:drug/metabolite transporter (DMT)-like permease